MGGTLAKQVVRGKRYGLGAVADALQGLEFPMATQELIRQAGARTVEFYPHCPVLLARVLLENPQISYFLSPAQVGEVISRYSRAQISEMRSSGDVRPVQKTPGDREEFQDRPRQEPNGDFKHAA